jgi:phytoene dehydrogenase-like protein
MAHQHFDFAVIGAGFGGLATALELSRGGASVALFEALKYPGGCASTFTRRGHQFESGATLFSGFGEGQLFERWVRELNLDVEFQEIDPIVEMRMPSFHLDIPRKRDVFLERFLALPDAPVEKLTRFFAYQESLANVMWELFDDPAMLPPFGFKEVLAHIGRSPRYAALLPLVGVTLERVLGRFGLQDYQPLRTYLDAVCQITIQASVHEAEAPFALATMDYFFRGTGHVKGGVGQLAWALAGAVEDHKGQLFFADKVLKIEADPHGWVVSSRRRTIHAGTVVANMLPQDLMRLSGVNTRRLKKLTQRVEDGWGAAMLYLAVDPAVCGDAPHHVELVGDDSKPFIEGNHVFCSISGRDETSRAPDDSRTVTCSTHVPVSKMREMDDAQRAAYVAGVQETMRDTIRSRAPELLAGARLEMPGSPRTFERFTLRAEGLVGGIPRRAGLDNYGDLFPSAVARGLYMVGDSVFPGQSTLATSIGGVKLAQHLLG